MDTPSPSTLREALDFRISELLRYDFSIGFVAGVLTAWASVVAPAALDPVRGLAAGFVGVVLGVVIAAVALQAAFLDTTLLRQIDRIGKEPVRYLAPGLFTIVLSVWAALALLVAAVLHGLLLTWARATLDGLAGFLVIWSLTSVLPMTRMLVQFIALKRSAALADEGGSTKGQFAELDEWRSE